MGEQQQQQRGGAARSVILGKGLLAEWMTAFSLGLPTHVLRVPQAKLAVAVLVPAPIVSLALVKRAACLCSWQRGVVTLQLSGVWLHLSGRTDSASRGKGSAGARGQCTCLGRNHLPVRCSAWLSLCYSCTAAQRVSEQGVQVMLHFVFLARVVAVAICKEPGVWGPALAERRGACACPCGAAVATELEGGSCSLNAVHALQWQHYNWLWWLCRAMGASKVQSNVSS